MISFTFNFLLALLEDVEVDGVFPSVVGLSDEGFRSVVVVLVLVRDLVGDFVKQLVRVFIGDFVREVVRVFVGNFVGDFVDDFSGSISVGGLGSFIGDRGRV